MHVTRTEYQDRLHKLPSAESLRSDAITVELKDRYYAPPALTNQWSACRGRDVYLTAALPHPYLSRRYPGEIALTVNGVRKRAGIWPHLLPIRGTLGGLSGSARGWGFPQHKDRSVRAGRCGA